MANEFNDPDPVPSNEDVTSVSDSEALSDSETLNQAADSDPGRDPFEEIASDFSERHRAGETPSVEEYVKTHPELAEEIRELFPTIVAMERLKERKSPPPKPVLGGLPLEQLGDFRILGEIGRGGMGVVYEALQVSLGRHVAVKVLPRQALLDQRHVRRFEREAQTAAKLHHTNIVPVFGVGEQDGYHYIVMQFIPGVGLDEILVALRKMVLEEDAMPFRMDSSSRASHANHNAKALLDGNFSKLAAGGYSSSFVKNGNSGTKPVGVSAQTLEMLSTTAAPLSSSKGSSSVTSKSLDTDYSDKLASVDKEFYQSIAKIGQQVADALAYAHEQGTLHRDIKPGNLLLDGTGTVWVADFGLAKLAEQDNVSRTGDIVGTLSYMSPESFSGEVDARADIYALGLTLFEMLAMRPAYYGRDRAKLVKQITDGELPRLGKLNPSIPRDLETIVLKAIAHRPEDRYPTARELADDLDSFQNDMPIKARRMSVPEQLTRWCRKNKLVASLSTAVLTLLVALTTTFGVLNWQTAVAKHDVEEQKELAENANAELQVAIARVEKERENGKQLAQGAIDISLSYFDSLAPDRLPLSADQSLKSADFRQDDALSPEQLTGVQPALDEEIQSSEQAAATVIAPPVTAESAARLERLLRSFATLAKQAGNDEQFSLIFADLTLRVGKLHKMLGKTDEAREHFENAIQKYTALVDSRESHNAAIVGLAISHNEMGDLISRGQSGSREAHQSYENARNLLEKDEALLAESPRAKYELARTLFLMSIQRVPQFIANERGGRRGGGRGGPGRGGPGRRGPGRGARPGGREFGPNSHLTKAISILEPLVETEANPEYRYLLARCYTGLGIVGRRSDQRRENIEKAITALSKLVHDQPEVADYKFEFAVAKLRSIEMVPNGSKRIDVAREAVKLLDEIVLKNPDVSNYVQVQALALLRYAEVLDRHADNLAQRGATDAAIARDNMVVTTNRASEVLGSARQRFPKDMEAMSRRFPGLNDFDFLMAKALAAGGDEEAAITLYREILKRLDPDVGKSAKLSASRARIDLAELLNHNGQNDEAHELLRQSRDLLRQVVDKEVAHFDRRRESTKKLFETLELLCVAENQLSSLDTAKQLVESVREKRLQAIEQTRNRKPTMMEIAEIDLRASRVLRLIGESEESEQLTNRLQSELSSWVAEFDPNAIQMPDPPRSEDFRPVIEFMMASRLLAEFFDDEQQLANLRSKQNELRKLFEKFRPESRRGGGGRRSGQPLRPQQNRSRE